jgi:hypothetical protein
MIFGNCLGLIKNDNKKVLEKNFKIEIDYLVLRQLPENYKGGRLSEKIMLNIKTFKKQILQRLITIIKNNIILNLF